jgi:hypothetical protein
MNKIRTGSFRSKACPRCGGDAYLNRDEGLEWVCLQCGRTVPAPAGIVVMERYAERKAEPAASRAA